jgi:hypothetical protein
LFVSVSVVARPTSVSAVDGKANVCPAVPDIPAVKTGIALKVFTPENVFAEEKVLLPKVAPLKMLAPLKVLFPPMVWFEKMSTKLNAGSVLGVGTTEVRSTTPPVA